VCLDSLKTALKEGGLEVLNSNDKD
jgi:hypothetical protein